MIIDFHVHTAFYETVTECYGSYIRSSWQDCETAIEAYSSPEGFLGLMDEGGIDYVVILAELAPITTGISNNEYVAEFCSKSSRLIPFASVNPLTTPRPAQELERLVAEYGFRGLKLYPTYQYYYPNDPMIYPIYAKAQELGIPVSMHLGSSIFVGSRIKYGDPIYVDDVAVDFPDLTLVQCHSGRPFWYDRAFGLARLHKNVYMEISGLPPKRLLNYFPEMDRLADKVIYGSDWPGVPTIKENIKVIEGLELKDETKRKILGENAARILGIDS
ncbi:MAG: amidohydrolase [Deltaproteobacteria bacterium]|nr:amidohydrolase [Deltaproteobacteria bacterium]